MYIYIYVYIYINLPANAIVRLPHPPIYIHRRQERRQTKMMQKLCRDRHTANASSFILAELYTSNSTYLF